MRLVDEHQVQPIVVLDDAQRLSDDVLAAAKSPALAQVRFKLTPAPGSLKSVVNHVSEIVLKGQCMQCA